MSRSHRQHLRDEELVGAIRRALSHNILLGGEDDLAVSAEDGVVLLSGTVRTAAERDAAEKDARNAGAEQIENRLTVVAGEASDRDLESAVDQNLAEHPSIARNVGPRVSHGRAILTGHVEDLAEAREAVRAAEEVPGVFAVDDTITVSAPGREAPFDIDDATLLGEVSLALDNARIDIVAREIATKNGVVTLRGLAPQDEGPRAERIAATVPGVRRVDNKIQLFQSEDSADPDEALEARVLRALGSDHHTAIATLVVIARDGNVTITGPVASIEGQNAITRIASAVEGVRQVDNRTVLKDVTSVRSGDKGVFHRRRAG